MLTLRAALLLVAHASALRIPPPSVISRRDAVTLPALALLAPASPAAAVVEGGAQWELDLPASFAISRRLASIVRSRVSEMLMAEDPTSGVQARLLLIPLGQQAAGSLNSDDQLLLASHFFGGSDGGSAEDVAKVMSGSAARSPSVVKVERVGGARERKDRNGRTYVSFGYDVQKCAGELLDDKECLGDVSSRRTLSSLTVAPISQYRTNTERQRMEELGQKREVNVLWLLTLSAPDGAAYEKLAPAFERASKSFEVPDVEG